MVSSPTPDHPLSYSPRSRLHNLTVPLLNPKAATWDKQPFWWAFLGGLLATLLAVFASTESLWVDELHTSWAVSGQLADVGPRAREGNQSPLFFWPVWGLVQTLGFFDLSPTGALGPEADGVPAKSVWTPAEAVLRLPSSVAWGLAVFACLMWAERALKGKPKIAIALLVWLLLDRIFLFYGTEARVYAWVQLVALLGWMAIWRLPATLPVPHKAHRTFWMGQWSSFHWLLGIWRMAAICMLFLHITAGLAVLWQAVVGTVVVYRRQPTRLSDWSATLLVCGVAGAVALSFSDQAWERRAQWQSFAGDDSLSALLQLFPLATYLLPVAVARGLDWVLTRTSTASPSAVPDRPDASANLFAGSLLWSVACFGPWLTAWLVTAVDLAPIFHRRFVITSGLPLAMLATTQLVRIRRGWLCWAAAACVTGGLIVGQGTLASWQSGQWIGWQRVEDWRGAANWLSGRIDPGDELWCASGLIEGHTVDVPLAPQLDRYLSFPLRGIYSVTASRSSGQFVEPHALVADSRLWKEQLDAAEQISRLSGLRVVWIVYRGPATTLARKLQSLLESERRAAIEPKVILSKSFGRVSVAKLEYPPD